MIVSNYLDNIKKERCELRTLYLCADQWEKFEKALYRDTGIKCSISPEIRKRAQRLEEHRTAARDLLNLVKDPAAREVLELLYLNGLSAQVVADKLYYSDKYIYRLRKKGIEEIEAAYRS